MKAFRGLLAFVLLGAVLGEDTSEERSTEDSSNGGCANFAGELYYGVRESLPHLEEFAISPVGVASLLGTLLFAVGQTSADEIANFLYPTCDLSYYVPGPKLNLSRGASQLTMTTVAMVRRGASVDKQFEDQAEELGSFVYRTSFWSYEEDFNEFVSNKTGNGSFRALDAVLEDPPDSSTKLLFFNRLAYRAQFEQKFSLVNGKLVARRAQALHAHVPELEARVLALPLLNSTAFLLILVPEQGSDLKSVERRLRKVDVRKLPGKLNATTMDITLQRIRQLKYLYLDHALEKVGIKTVFNATTADLSAFNREMPLDNVLVATNIELDEDGIDTNSQDFYKKPVTNKAAAGKSVKFKALGPIVFAIVDSERVFLMGRSFGL